MDIRVDDILQMKKKHPCGTPDANKMRVLRSGMDLRLRCEGCGHTFMISRVKIEKNVKNIIRTEATEEND